MWSARTWSMIAVSRSRASGTLSLGDTVMHSTYTQGIFLYVDIPAGLTDLARVGQPAEASGS